LVDNASLIIDDFEALKNYIRKKNSEDIDNNNQTRVRIRSNWNTPIRYTVSLVNLCNELNVAKAIDVIRKIE